MIVDMNLANAASDSHSERFISLLTSEELSEVRRDHTQFLQLLKCRCAQKAITSIEVEEP